MTKPTDTNTTPANVAFRFLNAAYLCGHVFTPMQNLVLLAIAKHTNYRNGISWSSYERLMYHTGIKSNSTISAAIRALQKAKVLYVKKRPNSPNHYWLDVQKMEELAVPFFSKRQRSFVKLFNLIFALKTPATVNDFYAFITTLKELRKEGHDLPSHTNVYQVIEWFMQINRTNQLYKILPDVIMPDGRTAEESKIPRLVFADWDCFVSYYDCIFKAYESDDKHFLAYIADFKNNDAAWEAEYVNMADCQIDDEAEAGTQ